MTQTNETPDANDQRRYYNRRRYRYLLLLVIINCALLFAAWRDRSWDAFAIAIFYGPTINLGLAGTALWRDSRKQKYANAEPALRPITLILIALAVAILEGIAIFSMGLRGG